MEIRGWPPPHKPIYSHLKLSRVAAFRLAFLPTRYDTVLT